MPKQRAISVFWKGEELKVWVVDGFDQYLDAFAAEVNGQLDDQRCPFGVLLWPSARTLADYLALQGFDSAPQKIVELGCGVGFLSCVLARLYPQADIFACDYEGGLGAFVERNAKEWGVADRVRFQTMDWRKPVPQELLGQCDAVFGTDVFYDDSHILNLPSFAHGLLKVGGRLVLADPKRYRFGKALEELQQHFDLESIHDEPCSLEQEGIEAFMIETGLREQKISILQLKYKS